MSSDATAVEVQPKRYRKLRIAWSVMWGIAFVLLICLWARSNRVDDSIFVFGWFGREIQLGSAYGDLNLRIDSISRFKKPSWQHSITSLPAEATLQRPWFVSRFRFRWQPGVFVARLPLWFLLGLSCATASTPWGRRLRYRFSLRTLLIVTTLVALVLGVVVWMAR